MSTARLVAMGEMVSGLAHELNQPLAAVSSYCSAALNMLKNRNDTTEIIPALEKAVEQAQRSGQIIRKVYSLARRSEGTLEPVRLSQRIDAVAILVEADFRRRGICIRTQISSDPVVEGDAVLIEQALFNLIRNAGDAVSTADTDRRLVCVRLTSDERNAVVEVVDSGIGITPDIQGKLFDPLFTTKPEGMGMGLSICRSIAEYHKGRIEAALNPAGGSIFSIRFPLLTT